LFGLTEIDNFCYLLQAWETRYMLLLWLSMACMIPFDLVKLDSNAIQESGGHREPIMDRIFDAAKVITCL